jgi:hypothetical protein
MRKDSVNLLEHSSISEQVTGIFRIRTVDTKSCRNGSKSPQNSMPKAPALLEIYDTIIFKGLTLCFA